jgi:hypothetical protein
VTRLKWNLDLVCLEIVLILKQDRCMVCTEQTINSKVIWTHPLELLGNMGLVESHFSPFRDSVSVGVR